MTKIDKIFQPIQQVIIYAGHRAHPLFGPYVENIAKRVEMFNYLNKFRQKPWNIETIDGDCLIDRLSSLEPKHTLLVIPAGQSSKLDKVFCAAQCTFIKSFLERGGYGYFNCGSAYMVSKTRIFHDLCEESPLKKKTLIKESRLPLFDGIAEGPLCPYPGKKYNVGFFSDAVTVTDGRERCTIYLSGGGSFQPAQNNPSITILLRYLPAELQRHGIKKDDIPKWENAALLSKVGNGRALLTMFHPYYNSHDFDPDRYERAFPDSGTDWRKIRDSLTPLEERMHFIYHSLIEKLEE